MAASSKTGSKPSSSGSIFHASAFSALAVEGESDDEQLALEPDDDEDDELSTPAPQTAPAPPAAPPAPLSKSALKRLARQNALASATSSNASSGSASPSNGIVLPEAEKADVATLAVSTPEVEALREMGVANDGSGPASGPGKPSSDSPSLSNVPVGPGATKATVASKSPSAASSASSSAFKPSNLPSDIPHLAPASPLRQKRHPPPDFAPSEVKEKKAVRFESSVVGGEDEHLPLSKEDEEARAKKSKKMRDAGIRTASTLAMMVGFLTLLLLGHPYVIVLVEVCQTLVYKEVTALFAFYANKSPASSSEDKEVASKTGAPKGGDRWSKTLNWYFFAVTNYFLYGESIIYYFKHVVFVDAYFAAFARNHRFVSFMLYVVGFVGFVMSLQKPYLSQQFALFCWVHMSLLVIVVSSHFIVNNILEGLIWFFLPASLVICNDIFAYVCGMIWGKTPLIKLSPKKTVEGFVGAFACTLVFAVVWGTLFMRYDYMICPVRDLGTSAWSGATCEPNSVFVWRDVRLPQALVHFIQSTLHMSLPTLRYAPFQLHCLAMACFASLFAPFGGFFASGFKRAFGIKDFGHSIPGHGGMTDRMDCQFLMGLFAYVYYSSIIRVNTPTVQSVMQAVVAMSDQGQIEVARAVAAYLEGKGVAF